MDENIFNIPWICLNNCHTSRAVGLLFHHRDKTFPQKRGSPMVTVLSGHQESLLNHFCIMTCDYCTIALCLPYPTTVPEWSNHSNQNLPQTNVWIELKVVWSSKLLSVISKNLFVWWVYKKCNIILLLRFCLLVKEQTIYELCSRTVKSTLNNMWFSLLLCIVSHFLGYISVF